MVVRRTIQKKRKTKPKLPPQPKRGSKLKNPVFENWEEWSGEEFHKKRREAVSHFYLNYKPQDLIQDFWQWMKANKYSALEIKAAKECDSIHAVSVNMAILSKLLECGMPSYNDKHAEYWESLPGTNKSLVDVKDYLDEKLQKAIEYGKNKIRVETEIQEISIQDRIKNHATQIIEDLNKYFDTFLEDPKSFKSDFDFINFLRANEISKHHTKYIRNTFQSEFNEYKLMVDQPLMKKTLNKNEIDQITEGYSWIKLPYKKEKYNALLKLMEALDLIDETAKVKRQSKKRKPISIEKSVEKVKYQKRDDKFKIVSLEPKEIPGAIELWIFNTKMRKLIYLKSDKPSGLKVKNTSIIDYSEANQKTLRKPDEQLKEFKSLSKLESRRYFNDINSVSTNFTGRLNENMIILKKY